MNNSIILYLDDKGIERLANMNSKLGNVMLNIAVINAPKDTGNLQRSISMPKNTSKLIEIKYNSLLANYSYFLEEGLGPVKKYKGFISNTTKNDIVELIVSYAESGVIPPFSFTPHIKLKSTSNLFPKERAILNGIGNASIRISADVRQQISIMREMEYAKANGLKISTRKIGTTVRTVRGFNIRSNRALSRLKRQDELQRVFL